MSDIHMNITHKACRFVKLLYFMAEYVKKVKFNIYKSEKMVYNIPRVNY